MDDEQYGYKYNQSGGSKRKNDQSAKDFKSLTEDERIFTRSHVYGGSSDRVERMMCVFDQEKKRIVRRVITTPKCMERCFLEVFTNGTDNAKKSREQGVEPGSMKIKMDKDTISIENEDLPIPVEPHPELCQDGEFGTVVDLIFSKPGSGSNLDDDFTRETSGVNGVGVKLVNILSRYFEVEVGDNIRGVHQKVIWTRNKCTKVSSVCTPNYVLRDGEWALDGPRYTGRNFVKVTWKQDFRKFGCDSYSDDDFELYMAYVAGFSFASKIKIYFNDISIDYRDISAYANLISPETTRTRIVHHTWSVKPEITDKKEIATKVATGALLPVVEMCFLDTPDAGFHVSFGNGIFNCKGGVHTNAAYKATLDIAKEILLTDKSFKMTEEDVSKLTITTLKKHATLIMNYKCINPSFGTQEKEELTKPTPKITLGSEYIAQIKKWGVLEKIYDSVHGKVKTISKKKRKADENFKPANMVGVKGVECILLPCEGKSAGSYVDQYILNKDGRYDIYAKFAMRGKIRNVSGLSNRQMDVPEKSGAENELVKFMETVGLRDGVDYTTPEGIATLHYKWVRVMVDADSDGSHILCLLINFLYRRFPTFLKAGRLSWVVTPIIRAIVNKTGETIERFYNLSDYRKWAVENPRVVHKPDYFKGLATASPEQAKEDAELSPNYVLYFDDEAEIYLNVAFDQGVHTSDIRKSWILQFKDHIEDRIFEDEQHGRDVSNFVRISKLLNSKLIEYSLDTLPRCLISYMDHLKLSQRQLCAYLIEDYSFGLSDKEKKKLVTIASAAADKFEYHHGDLTPVLARMALDYPGSNNLPFLAKTGTFGTRVKLGKDCGAGRYVKSKPNWWIQHLIKKELYELVPRSIVEGKKVEPTWIPFLLPLGLINGTRGISTGWACFMTNYHPGDICEWIYNYICGEEVFPMMPWFIGFTGNISLEFKSKGTKKTDIDLRDDEGFDTYGGLTCKTEGIFTVTRTYKKKITVEIEDPNDSTKTKKVKEDADFCDFEITEVPIGVETNKLFVKLSNMCENAMDKSKTTDTPHFIFEGYAGVPEAKDIGMTSRDGLSNITTVDEKGIPVVFDNVYQVMVSYCNNLSELFAKLKEKKIEDLKVVIATLEMKHFLIKKAVLKDFIFIDRVDSELEAELESYKIPYSIFESIKSRQYTINGQIALEEKIKSKYEDLDKLIARDHLEDWRDHLLHFHGILSRRQEYKKLARHVYPRISTPIQDLLSGRVVSPYPLDDIKAI